MTLENFQHKGGFRESDCDLCGLCFHKCPVLNLPLDIAKQEIQSLIESGKSKRVLNSCTSCMACNHYCPNNCNPHALILAKWNERYLKKGLPIRAKLALPYHFPNIYSININKLPKDEKALTDQWELNWKDPKGAETVLYTGCNVLIQPFLLESKIYKDLTIFGSPKLCCGEPLYRMGCLDAAKVVAQYLKEQFEAMKFKKMIVACLAGYNLFKYVYNEVHNVKFNFEIVSIIDWLWERIKSGEIEVTPLNKTAIIHDNCWPKANGNHFFDRIRDILDYLGVEVIEPKHTRENALCCGIGAAASRYSLYYSFKSARDRLKELNRKKVDFIIDYCGGCNWFLSVAKKTMIFKLPIYHICELVQKGIGEELKHRTNKRARTILTSMVGKAIFSYLNTKNFWIEKIIDKPVPKPDI